MNKKKKKAVMPIPKIVSNIAKVGSVVSPQITARLSMRLFRTPIKFKRPRRELASYVSAVKEEVMLERCGKIVVKYRWGQADKKVLLVHGWNGRATQLFCLAEAFVEAGYEVHSFDAPGHGESPKNQSVMLEFMEAVEQFASSYGIYEAIIGHSLGAMATLLALSKGTKTQKAVAIGSGDLIDDIFGDFAQKVRVSEEVKALMIAWTEKKYEMKISDFDVSKRVQDIELPVLLIHDKNDAEVHFEKSVNIHKHCVNSTLMLTENLGHNKILGDEQVVGKILDFVAGYHS